MNVWRLGFFKHLFQKRHCFYCTTFFVFTTRMTKLQKFYDLLHGGSRNIFWRKVSIIDLLVGLLADVVRKGMKDLLVVDVSGMIGWYSGYIKYSHSQNAPLQEPFALFPHIALQCCTHTDKGSLTPSVIHFFS